MSDLITVVDPAFAQESATELLKALNAFFSRDEEITADAYVQSHDYLTALRDRLNDRLNAARPASAPAASPPAGAD